MNVSIGLIYDTSQHILITQRGPTLSMGGLWEFPGGKLELGETPEMSLVIEIDEEVGLTIQKSDLILEIKDIQRTLFVFLVTQFHGHASKRETQQDLRWINPLSVKDYEFPPTNHPILDWISGNILTSS